MEMRLQTAFIEYWLYGRYLYILSPCSSPHLCWVRVIPSTADRWSEGEVKALAQVIILETGQGCNLNPGPSTPRISIFPLNPLSLPSGSWDDSLMQLWGLPYSFLSQGHKASLMLWQFTARFLYEFWLASFPRTSLSLQSIFQPPASSSRSFLFLQHLIT